MKILYRSRCLAHGCCSMRYLLCLRAGSTPRHGGPRHGPRQRNALIGYDILRHREKPYEHVHFGKISYRSSCRIVINKPLNPAIELRPVTSPKVLLIPWLGKAWVTLFYLNIVYTLSYVIFELINVSLSHFIKEYYY
jgi:hypothetical protein